MRATAARIHEGKKEVLLSGQFPDLQIRRQKVKVFWFFSSEKNKTLLFLKKKKQKDFTFLRFAEPVGIWPDNGVPCQRFGGNGGGEPLRNKKLLSVLIRFKLQKFFGSFFQKRTAFNAQTRRAKANTLIVEPLQATAEQI